MKQMKDLTKEEFVHILRRQSTGFARGSSRYRGVTLHKCGRWEARMGQFLGKKAYDKAAIQCNGSEAVTNFEPSTYEGHVSMQPNTHRGGAHNLDLNLGISITIDGLKGSSNLGAGDSQTHHSSLPPANGKRPVEKDNNKKRDQAMSSERFSNWAWYAQSQGQGGGGGAGGGGHNSKQVQVQQLLSNSISAASSGFSSLSSANYHTFHPFTNEPVEKPSTNHPLHHPPPPSSFTTNSSFHPYAQDR